MKIDLGVIIRHLASVAAVTSLLGASQTLFANPLITMQPQSETVRAGGNATFVVGATGSAPLAYLWQSNGVAISGSLANGPSFTVNGAQAAQSGTRFNCIVSDATGSQTSSAAELSVTTNALKIALVNPDYYRGLKCGEYNPGQVNPGAGPVGYYSVANGSIADSGGYWTQAWMTNTASWTGLGQSPDYLTTVLTSANYQVDIYSSSNFPSIIASNYSLVIVQDPLTQVGSEHEISVETNTPDVLNNIYSPVFFENLEAYYNSGGSVILVGNAVRLLENGTNRLNYGKKVLVQNNPNTVTRPAPANTPGYVTSIPGHWQFVMGAPFCCNSRIGSGSDVVQQSSIVLPGETVSQVSLVNGNDYGIAEVWSESIYYPTDAVSLLDVSVEGTGQYVLEGDTCDPVAYQSSVNLTNQDFMGYTTVNGRKIYFIGSDALFDLQFTDYLGGWHCSNPELIQNQVSSVGTDAILGLVGQAVSPQSIKPILAAIPNTNINEQVLWQYTPNFNGGGYTFGLSNSPSGMTVNSASGTIEWVPTQPEATHTYSNITYIVYQSGTLFESTNFNVTVNDINVAPVLSVPVAQTVYPTATLTVANTAIENDIWATSVFFDVVSAPSGVQINSDTGVLTWTPTVAQAASTNTITISATDYDPYALNSQFLSVANSFTVIVKGITPPTILEQPVSAVVGAGQSVTFSATVAGYPTPTCQWQFNGTNIPGATSNSYTIPASSLSNIGYYTLVATSSAGTTTSVQAGLTFLNINMYAGLKIFGPINASYQIQAISALNGTNWLTLTNVTATTEPFIYIDYNSPASPRQFYRAVPQ